MRSLSLIAVLVLAGCSGTSDAAEPAGSTTTRTFALSDFRAIALGGSDDVDVRVGTGFSVRAQGPASDLAQLRIVRDGETLRIDRKPRLVIGWVSTRGVKVFVTMPQIVAAEIGGSGTMTIDRVEGSSFTAATTGSGNLQIAALATSQAVLATRGSGTIAAKGSIDRIAAKVSGSGEIAGRGLKVRDAVVSVAGSGGLRLDVSGAATGSLTGSGDIDLGRPARCTISKAGSGEVRCGG